MAAVTKVSQITTQYVADYLRIDNPATPQLDELGTMLASAKSFVTSYTGLPETSQDATTVTLDSHAEFVMAVLVLVQNYYDNRTFYSDAKQVEAVVDATLGMHRSNLL